RHLGGHAGRQAPQRARHRRGGVRRRRHVLPDAHRRRIAPTADRCANAAPRRDPGGPGVKAGFPREARAALADSQLRRNLHAATSTIRDKRLRVVAEVDDWEQLRDAGAAIKAQAMATLPEQLERLEASVQRAGGTVHWARDAAEARSIVAG